MKITKLRVTQTATSVVAAPFVNLTLAQAAAMRGFWHAPSTLVLANLSWDHPWNDPKGNPVGVDRAYWAWTMELSALTGSVNDAFTARMIRHAVPLRAQVPLAVAAVPAEIQVHGQPVELFAEVFIQPWAASAAITATLNVAGIAIDDAATLADAVEHVTVTSPHLSGPMALTTATNELAELIARTLSSSPDPCLAVAPARLGTIIDATLPDPLADFTTDPKFCYSMYQLAGTIAPGLPFQWTKCAVAGIGQCSTGEVRVVVKSGVAQWSQGALITHAKDPLLQTPGVHRSAVLQWTTLAAIHGLLDLQPAQGDPAWFGTLREDHGRMLGRLYGPSNTHLDWLAQAYVRAHALDGKLSNPTINVDGICP